MPLKIASAAVAIAVGFHALSASRDQVESPPIVGILDAYDRGDYAAMERQLFSQPSSRLASQLRRDGDRWIGSAPNSQTNRRRVVAASVALEVVGAGLQYEWLDVVELVEWACRRIRELPEGSDAERLWHLGSISLLQDGAAAMPTHRFAPGHILEHVPARLPDDDRVRLAAAVELEMAVANVSPRRIDRPLPSPETVAQFRRRASAASAALSALLKSPEVGAEARVRLATLHLRIDEPQTAVELLQSVDVPADRYLAHLTWMLMGEAHRRLRDQEQASAAYRRALELVPGAMSASLGLAASQAEAGDLQGAIDAVRVAARPQSPVDPWRILPYADARLWLRWRTRLREILQP